MLRRLTLAAAVATASMGWAVADSLNVSPRSDLVSVYQQAALNNADLGAARADFKARQEQVPQARAGLLPNLSAGIVNTDSQSKVDTDLGNIDAKRSGLHYQASLSQPLFRIDRWYQLQAAHALTEQAAINLSATEQQLILDSAEAYFAVLRAQDNLAATKAEETAFKRQMDQANERFDVGLTDKTDVLEAQAGFDAARANRIFAERQVQDALEHLSTLTNHRHNALEGIRHSLPILPPTPADASAWVNTASVQNLNLKASEYAVTAAEENLRQRKAGHAPSLDAVAQYKRGDNDSLGFSSSASGVGYRGDAEQRSIGLQLNIPLYSGGLVSSQVRESTQRLDQVQQQRESLRRVVVENTRNFYRAVNTDVETVQARRQSIISTQSALEATEIGYQVGTRNIVDVLNAQRQLYSAVRNYNNARYDYILNNLRLKQVAGTLSPDDLAALGEYLKPDYNPDKDFLPPDLARIAEQSLQDLKNL